MNAHRLGELMAEQLFLKTSLFQKIGTSIGQVTPQNANMTLGSTENYQPSMLGNVSFAMQFIPGMRMLGEGLQGYMSFKDMMSSAKGLANTGRMNNPWDVNPGPFGGGQ